MAHAHHFLSRLDRVKRETVDFALSLYRDAELVKWILGTIDLPDSAERVAIALLDMPQAPHIIVARNGHFVTCLGEGMSTGPHPIITRPRLDGCLKEVASFRAQRALRRDVIRPGGEDLDLFRLAFKRGDDLSLEEFDAIACWAPLMASDLYVCSLEMLVQALRQRDLILDAPKLEREPKFLREYWSSLWAVSHLMVLAASADPAALGRVVDYFDEQAQTPTFLAYQLGITGIVARNAWFTARVGAKLLPHYRREYESPRSRAGMFDAVLGLDAIRVTDESSAVEVARLFDQRPAVKTPESIASAEYGSLVVSISDEQAERVVLTHGKRLCMELTRDLPRDHALAFERAEDVPDAYAIAAAARHPAHFRMDPEAELFTLSLARLLVRREAREFFLPETFRDCARPDFATQARALLAQQRIHDADKPKLVVAATRVGRNEACTCGSGKKYKRCCGA